MGELATDDGTLEGFRYRDMRICERRALSFESKTILQESVTAMVRQAFSRLKLAHRALGRYFLDNFTV
jgi:hypothetical protein